MLFINGGKYGVSRKSSYSLSKNYTFTRLKRRNFSTTKEVKQQTQKNIFDEQDQFLSRHIGSYGDKSKEMLKYLGCSSLDDLISKVVPQGIRSKEQQSSRKTSKIPEHGLSEADALAKLKHLASRNKIFKNYIGQGYYGTHMPAVIARNMLENPAWYTAYTPYQSEVSQGRLEMLLNFQTMVQSLTKMDVSNCSLLDEGTAAAEALNMSTAMVKSQKKKFLISSSVFDQTLAVVRTRAVPLDVEVVVVNEGAFLEKLNSKEEYCGALVQYPNKFGEINSVDYDAITDACKRQKTLLTVATDLLALTVIKPPGEFGSGGNGCDIVIGSSQRFGVPLFFGGPHAAFMAVTNSLVRQMPGRLIGVSKDANGKTALRMALQTREQFIKREKATSNICTAQALLANLAAAYAIFHGPEGLKEIATKTHLKAKYLSNQLSPQYTRMNPCTMFFDTISFNIPSSKTAEKLQDLCLQAEINVNMMKHDEQNILSLSVDETIKKDDLDKLISVLTSAADAKGLKQDTKNEVNSLATDFRHLARASKFLEHPVFNVHQSETEVMRYLHQLQQKDVTLLDAMIPLGSCTMKLNAAAELLPVSWPGFKDIHPFAPSRQTSGWQELIKELNEYLAELTGFAAVSSQPNSGAAGEYAGLLVIRKYHDSRNDYKRNVCLIPMSAHGTNPASAAMAGLKVIGVKNTKSGHIDIEDLKEKASRHKNELACLMITYPSTYGVFESEVREIISICKQNGGLVYMDGANMNAQLGICSPGDIGADVCHLNLHKTFSIPHGGGGPGVGSIGVSKDLVRFLPGHVRVSVFPDNENHSSAIGQVSSAPFGSAGILPISYSFINMIGRKNMMEISAQAMLKANYMAKLLSKHYDILFLNQNGFCGHEFILDLRFLSKGTHNALNESDVAKRLADFGFHAGTMSWPVPGTMMVEPTESESKEECERFVQAMAKIKSEIDSILNGQVPVETSLLKNAPHSMETVLDEKLWNMVPRSYTREEAVFPLPFVRRRKFWPNARVDNVLGDRNLICSCPTVEELMA